MEELLKNLKDSAVFFSQSSPASNAATNPLVCLNFKVPLRVRQQLKMHAAKRNVSMTELLLKMVDDLIAQDFQFIHAPSPIKK